MPPTMSCNFSLHQAPVTALAMANNYDCLPAGKHFLPHKYCSDAVQIIAMLQMLYLEVRKVLLKQPSYHVACSAQLPAPRKLIMTRLLCCDLEKCRHMVQEQYAAEGIDWSYVEFIDNQDCLDLLEGSPINPSLAVFPLIDEACRMPRATYQVCCCSYLFFASITHVHPHATLYGAAVCLLLHHTRWSTCNFPYKFAAAVSLLLHHTCTSTCNFSYQLAALSQYRYYVRKGA